MTTVSLNAGVSSVTPPPSPPERMESIRRNGEESPVARVRRETGTNLNAERAEQVRFEEEPQSKVRADDLSREELRTLAENLGQIVSTVNEGISFRIDESADMLIAEFVNRETNEVIKQIPPEELVRLAGRLREFLGVLLDIEV